MKPVPGICDRCGLRFHHKDLKFEYEKGRKTGLLICRDCDDPSHPQLDTERVRSDDKQSVKDARSDRAENIESRRLYGWNPVGHPSTGSCDIRVGRVTVSITEAS